MYMHALDRTNISVIFVFCPCSKCQQRLRILLGADYDGEISAMAEISTWLLAYGKETNTLNTKHEVRIKIYSLSYPNYTPPFHT